MKKITILDTSITSPNLGDQIIMDSVNAILNNLFDGDFFIKIPTHDVIAKTSYRYMKNSDYIIVGGTNLLSSNMDYYNQWKISVLDSFFIKNIILMGVGWWQYQKKPNLYTKYLYSSVLNKQYLHSVRDEYTKQQLESIGFTNILNTGCPTMWNLTPEHCADIPRTKSDSVLVTFTEYNQNREYDCQLFEILKNKYEKIYFWTQQPKDYTHMYEIGGDVPIYLQPSLKALDELLNKSEVDYIGTRLHAGIRSLQFKKRSLILAVDNRATEIAKDTDLPVIPRNDGESIRAWIDSSFDTQIELPWSNINKWKKQFMLHSPIE